MRFMRLLLPLAIISASFGFELNGDFQLRDNALALELGVKEKFNEKIIGKISRKELVKCEPSIGGISEYSQKSIIIYKPNLHAGFSYTCQAGDSKVEFKTGAFKVNDFKKLDKKRYIIEFSDDINASELTNSLKINANFNAQNIRSNAALIILEKATTQLNFSLKKGFKSVHGAQTLDDFNKTFSTWQDKNTPEFKDNERAKTLVLTSPISTSLENGKMGVKFYLADWLDVQGIKKFIKIEGVKNFSIQEPSYIGYYKPKELNLGDDINYELIITSDEFKPQTEYKLSILPGFGDENWLVRNEQSFSVKLENLKPFVSFINDLPYISSVGTIGIKSANTPQIKVVVEKLSDQNYRYFLNFKEHEISELSSEVAQKTYDLGGTLNELNEHKIKLDFAGSGDGVYLISIFYDKDKIIQKAVYLSDIAINAKLSKDELFIFANRIGESIMLANANVKIYGHKNEEIGVGATNDEGIYRLNKKDIYKDAKSVVVSFGKEQNFLILNDDEHLNKEAYHNNLDANESINAFVHFASNIIRPNENIKGVIHLRTDEFQPLKQMPVKLKFSDSQDKKLLEISLKTNEFGVLAFDEELTSELTGKFMLDVIYASKIVKSIPFFVESFTPARIKNEIALVKDSFKNNELLQANFTSTYLFGAPAANLKASAELIMSGGEYQNENYKNFSFKNRAKKDINYQSVFKDFNLENNGTAEQIFAIALPQDASSLIDAFLIFNTNDDGKSVSTTKKFSIFPYENIVGVRADKDFIEPKERVKLEAIALDATEFKPQNRLINFEIKRQTWQYNMDERGNLHWFSELETIAEFEKSEPFEYEFSQSGEYFIIATDKLSGASASTDISVSGFNYSSLAPTKELSKAQIKLNAASYKAGEIISADISSVIKEGLALITLEANGVIAHKLTQIKNNSANVKFTAPKNFNGAYLSVSIYRLADDANLPYRAYQKVYARANMDHKMLETAIIAPQTTKTNQTLKIEVKTVPNADVSIFTTDFGVLNITDQKVPNPLKFFNKTLNDSVFDYDIYDKLTSYTVTGKVLNFGGDAAKMLMQARLAKHESPVDSKNIQTFVKMARVQADTNGSASYELSIPQGLNSAIRIDVISANSDKIGSASHTLTIKDDIILKPSALSYIINDDELNAILRIINTTNKTKSLNLSFETSENLDINLSKASLNLEPNQSQSLKIKLHAKAVGSANFMLIAKDESGEIFTHSKKLDIINAYPKSTYAKSYSINKAQNFKLPKGFLSANIDASNSISSLVSAISKNLINYPYGCVEQRSSRLLALLYAKSKSDHQEQDRLRFIKSGLNELIKMQKDSGEFGYWNETSHVNTFASIYAADIIYELDNAGFNVDKLAKNHTINGLKELNFSNSTQKLYALYVLAKFNALNKSELNKIYDSKIYTKSILESYLIASALKILGHEKEANGIIKSKKIATQIEQKNEQNFYSKLRDDAFILFLHAKYFDKDAFSDELAKNLITKVNNANSTQERAFILRALNTYFPNQNGAKFSLTHNDKTSEFDKNANVYITTQNGEFKITPKAPMFVSISSDAYIKLDTKHQKEPKELDIFRTFVDNNGKEINLNELKPNNIIYSKLEISAKSPVEVGVINEITSTCFEAINENISANHRPNALKSTLNLEYQTLKDDRTLSFFRLNDSSTKTLYTPYRVVLSGKCTLPAVSIENMYNEAQNDYDLAQKSFVIK